MMDAMRPERMSKVSVTGSKAVMDDVVDVVHDMNLLHVTDYDDSWDGFDPGDPVEGADELSEKLVTVRSLESILDVDDDDAGPTRLVTDEAIETELEEIRTRVNELDDRREAIRDDLRAVEDHVDAMAPFAALGIDLDLLQGYESLQVAVGEGDEDAVRAALEAAEEIGAFELFTADGVVAAFARPADGAPEDALAEALVGAQFTAIEVPDLEGGPVDVDDPSPEAYLQTLESRRDQLESKLDTVENELEDEKLEAAGFLLAVEEKLAIEVQKHEAPLSFATTEHSFVAEGWLPTDRYDGFAERVTGAIDGRVEVEEIERARYDGHGRPEATEQVGGGAPAAAADGGDAATDGGEVATDGGGIVTVADDPPVVLDNPKAVRPLELLVETVGRPSYTEFDPTWLLFLTFPAFFGYMIGDVAYGLGYAVVGYLMMTRVDSEGIQKLGGVGVWCGAFTILFGVLYGEFLGLHAFGKAVWPSGHPPLEKGLGAPEFAKLWMLVTLAIGLVHVTVGHVLSFIKELEHHGASAAIFESGSWIVLMFGVWGWVLTVLPNASPDLFASTVGPASGDPALALGFMGLPDPLATPMLVVVAIGTVMLVIGEGVQAVEILQVLVNVLSYMRLMAVLLAKAGMAFVVNLFVFGLYEDDSGLHFLTTAGHSVEQSQVVFQGLFNMGSIGPIIGGVVVLVVGHLIVFALGITSAGLQALRLEYVEFFGKFYDGEGRTYDPFGYSREYTTED